MTDCGDGEVDIGFGLSLLSSFFLSWLAKFESPSSYFVSLELVISSIITLPKQITELIIFGIDYERSTQTTLRIRTFLP